MSRVMNWIYGILLILIALDAFFTSFSLIPEQFLPVAVIIVGALILFTPISSSPYTSTISQNIRRWVFGAAVVLMGVASLVQLTSIPFYTYLTIDSFYGQAILLLIGVIYLFAGTKTGGMPIRSV